MPKGMRVQVPPRAPPFTLLRGEIVALVTRTTSPNPALIDVPPENLRLSEAQVEYEAHSQAAALRIARIIKRTPDAQLIASADKIEKLDKIARKALKLEADKPRMAINIRLLVGGAVARLANASGVPANEALVPSRR